MGLLVDEESPIICASNGHETIQQFAENVDWGNLDFLLIDLPPGTGDAQLSSPRLYLWTESNHRHNSSKTAFEVAKRGARMFEKVNIPSLVLLRT